MPRSHTIEVGWMDADENDYRVILSYFAGSPGGWEEAPSGPEIEVIEVREDRPGGVERPDLIDAVCRDLDGRWGDDVADEIDGYEADARASAMEDRRDAARDERMLAGRR